MVKHKKGQVWNKPKNKLMLEFEKTGKSAVHNGKITGQFEYYLWQLEKKKTKPKPAQPKPKAKPKSNIKKDDLKDHMKIFEINKKILYDIFYNNNSKPLTSDEIKKLSNNQINVTILKQFKITAWIKRKKDKDGKFKWSPSGLWYIKPKPKPFKVDKYGDIIEEDIIKKQRNKVENDILKTFSGGRGQGYKTIYSKLDYNEGTMNRALKSLIDKGKIIREKKYKPDPSGRGLSRAYTVKYKLVRPKSKSKVDVEKYWNRMPQPQKRRSMFISDLGYDDAYIAINKKKQWIDLPNSFQNDIKKEKNTRVLKEIYNLSKTEFNEIYEEDINFNPEEIENGDYVDFGAYGNLYVVHRRDDRNFWVTDLKDKRYDDNAPGWIIRINQAERIIRKG